MESILALDTAELALYIVAILMYLLMINRINRWDSVAWWSLLGLCVARFIGAVTSIVYWFDGRRHQRRISGAALSVGLSFMLHTLVDVVGTVLFNLAGDERGRPIHRYFIGQQFLLFCITIVGVAGARVAYGPIDGKHTNVAEAAVVMQTIIAVILVPATIYCLVRCSGTALFREQYLLIASLVSLPFVLVANAYVACVAFLGPNETWSPVSTANTAVLRNGLMTLLPEMVMLVVFFWAGSKAKLAETDPEKAARARELIEQRVQAEMDAEKIGRAMEGEREVREKAERNGDAIEGERPPGYEEAEKTREGAAAGQRGPTTSPERSDWITICEPAATTDGKA